MSTTPPEAIDKLKHAPDVAGVDDLIRRRWSPRAYADKDVPAAELKRLFEAARWAASSSNEQPWRFLVGRRGDQPRRRSATTLPATASIPSSSRPGVPGEDEAPGARHAHRDDPASGGGGEGDGALTVAAGVSHSHPAALWKPQSSTTVPSTLRATA